MRELGRALVGQRSAQAGEQQAQQARQQRVRYPGVAWPGIDRERARLGLGEVADQARLAQARFAGDQARLAGRPVGLQSLPFGVAADQARRPQHAHRQRPRLRRVGRQAAGGDTGAQRLGLGVGGDAEVRSSTSQQRSNAARAAARSPRR